MEKVVDVSLEQREHTEHTSTYIYCLYDPLLSVITKIYKISIVFVCWDLQLN